MRRGLILAITLLVAVFLFFSKQLPVQAAGSGAVIINEIAWMGNTTSTADEWLELKNTTNQDIDLTGWRLSWDGAAIELAGLVPGNGYFLLERTDDNSVPNISADQIYTGALGNGGEDILLKDNADNVIDTADWNSGWLAGDNSTKQTMERVCPIADGDLAASWQTSELANGSPKQDNYGCQEEAVAEQVYEGRVCWLDTYRWDCQAAVLSISDKGAIGLAGADVNYQYEVIKQRQRRIFTFYLAKTGNNFVRVIMNTKRGNTMLVGRGIWFMGHLVN